MSSTTKSETINFWRVLVLKNTSNAYIGGVGLLSSSKTMKNLSNVEKISQWVAIIDFKRNPQTTILSFLSPHNDISDGDIDHLYNSLRSTFESVSAHNFLLFPGKVNAKPEPDDANFAFYTETYRNGEPLVDVMEEFNLCLAHSKFTKRKYGRTASVIVAHIHPHPLLDPIILLSRLILN